MSLKGAFDWYEYPKSTREGMKGNKELLNYSSEEGRREWGGLSHFAVQKFIEKGLI